jgi:IS605 OrfB family transposase
MEIEIPRFYRKREEKLATMQRARKTPKRIRNIHAKIANRRKDFLHKRSVEIVKKYGLIVVGDVSPSKLAKTRMAKSVLDAGWAGLKHMLSYKAITRGGMWRRPVLSRRLVRSVRRRGGGGGEINRTRR